MVKDAKGWRPGSIGLIVLGLAALVALYAMIGFFLLPRLAQHQVPRYLEEQLGLQVSVGSVHANPFLLRVEVRGLSVEGQHGRPVIAFDSLMADLAVAGLFRRAWTLDELRVRGLQGHLVRAPDGSLNMLQLARRLARADSGSTSAPARLVIRDFAVPDATLVYTDLTGKQPASATIAPVSLHAQGLNTVGPEPGHHRLEASLPAGGRLEWTGKLAWQPALSAEGEIELQGLSAAALWPFLRDQVRLVPPGATGTLAGRYAYDERQSLRLRDVSLDVADLLLAREAAGKPLLSLKRVKASGGSLDLARHAAAFSELALEQGQVNIQVGPDGSIDWAGLLAGGAGTGGAGEGSVDTDANAPAKEAAPAVGETPLAQTAEAPGGWSLDVARVRLAGVGLNAVDRSRVQPVSLGVGPVDARMRLSLSMGEPGRLVVQAIEGKVAKASIGVLGASEPALSLNAVSLAGGHLDLHAQSVGARELSLEGGQTSIVRKADGSVPLLDLLAFNSAAQGAAGGTAASGNPQPWRYELGVLRASGLAVALADRSFQPAVAYGLEISSLTARNIGNTGAVPTPFEVLVKVAPGGMLRASGTVAADGQSVQAELNAQALAMAPLRPLLTQSAGLPVTSGPLSLQGTVRYAAAGQGASRVTLDVKSLQLTGIEAGRRGESDPLVSARRFGASGHVDIVVTPGAMGPQLTAKELQLQLDQFALGGQGSPTPLVKLDTLTVSNGYLDLQGRRVGASKVVLADGSARIVRQPDGRFTGLEGLRAVSAGGSGAADRPVGGRAATPWRYAVDAVHVQAMQLQLTDHTTEPPLAVGGVLRARATDVASDKGAAFEAALVLNGGGKVEASGSGSPAAGVLRAQVALDDVALTPLQPLLARYAALSLQSGALSGSGEVRVDVGSAEPLRGSGSLQLADLVVNEAESGDRFLSWQKLDAQDVGFALGARTLSVQDVIIERPGAKIVIAQDRSVNLAQVWKSGSKSEAAAAGAGGLEKGAQGTADDGPPFRLSIGRIRLRDGEVDYADLSLVLPFSTRVTDLQGTIVAISTEPGRRAEIQASGGIQPYGSARVEGSIVPFEPARFTDLEVVFSNVPMPPLSPYTATFAGRKVESGRLWLDLDYRVENGELLGSNDIRLANFTLGERVEAPNAMNLPLNLAVALLTNSKGEIALSVPVRGDLDNPRFSVADAVKQALGNVLRRVLSAPFRALGKLFGGGAESLASIDFAPGSAALRPEQREKLDALTRALQERPQLQLVVNAPHDPEADAAVIRREQARQAVLAALGRGTGASAASEPIAYDDPATQRVLKRLLRDRAGDDAWEELRAEAGRTGGADTSFRALYQAVFDRIAAVEPVRDTATQVLATQRARAVAHYLQQQGVDAGRVQTGRIAAVQSGREGAVSAQLQVAAAGGRG